MKPLCTTMLLLLAAAGPGPGGDRERGLELYAAGRYEEAAAAFRLAIASEGDSAELQYNLALASWRAGDLATAETAIEKYAALAERSRTELHAGLLGAVRYEEARQLEAGAASAETGEQADPLVALKQALGKAEQARDHFVRGATAQQPPAPELLRNTERALRFIDELRKKIEELEQQREEQQDNEGENQDEQKSEDEPEQDEESKPEQNEEQKGEGEQGEQPKGEPKPDEPESQEGSQKPEEPRQQDPQQQQAEGGDQQQGEQRPEPQQQSEEEGGSEQQSAAGEPPQQAEPEPQQRSDAPGEVAEGRELSPEQTQRLLQQLRQLEQELAALRARAVSGRKPVERDW